MDFEWKHYSVNAGYKVGKFSNQLHLDYTQFDWAGSAIVAQETKKGPAV